MDYSFLFANKFLLNLDANLFYGYSIKLWCQGTVPLALFLMAKKANQVRLITELLSNLWKSAYKTVILSFTAWA
jgi:hypothetical protein